MEKREIQNYRKIMIFVVFVYRFVYSRIVIYRFITFIYIVSCIGKSPIDFSIHYKEVFDKETQD